MLLLLVLLDTEVEVVPCFRNPGATNTLSAAVDGAEPASAHHDSLIEDARNARWTRRSVRRLVFVSC